MNAYKTYVEIDKSGRMVLENLPFREGTLVEVLVVDQDRRSGQGAEGWRDLMKHVQGLPQSAAISDADIAAEIEQVRNIR
jgi:hypothetical protein